MAGELEKINTEITQAVIDAAMRFLNKYQFPVMGGAVDWVAPRKKAFSFFSADVNYQQMFEEVTAEAALKCKCKLNLDRVPFQTRSLVMNARTEAVAVYVALTRSTMTITMDEGSPPDNGASVELQLLL